MAEDGNEGWKGRFRLGREKLSKRELAIKNTRVVRDRESFDLKRGEQFIFGSAPFNDKDKPYNGEQGVRFSDERIISRDRNLITPALSREALNIGLDNEGKLSLEILTRSNKVKMHYLTAEGGYKSVPLMEGKMNPGFMEKVSNHFYLDIDTKRGVVRLDFSGGSKRGGEEGFTSKHVVPRFIPKGGDLSLK